ncbi:glycine-rich cell wall structural protein [Sus scrofa]|uniref:glycine-rich cell wall structural protein n=1 Tax=Sus scrofa TaxID=9823 RepID=UPI000A2B0E0C|nr:glycine-rich cell wall structural protein [Sus scrofa]
MRAGAGPGAGLGDARGGLGDAGAGWGRRGGLGAGRAWGRRGGGAPGRAWGTPGRAWGTPGRAGGRRGGPGDARGSGVSSPAQRPAQPAPGQPPRGATGRAGAAAAAARPAVAGARVERRGCVLQGGSCQEFLLKEAYPGEKQAQTFPFCFRSWIQREVESRPEAVEISEKFLMDEQLGREIRRMAVSTPWQQLLHFVRSE